MRSAPRAATLLAHPVRCRILHSAAEPISAADLARRLGLPRQRVNYHVRLLARAGFLLPAAQQKKRNMLEQRYVASARAYVLTPEVLGDVAPRAASEDDTASAAHLVALCAAAQTDVARVIESADVAGLRVRTLSLQSDLRFESVQQRLDFTSALRAAISDVIARYAPATSPEDHGSRPGSPFRLIVGCYPVHD